MNSGQGAEQPGIIIRAMLRLVLDTNVVLDLFHWSNADAVPIMDALAGGQVECLADAGTLDELQRVLTYPQLKLTPEMAAERYRRYSGLVQVVADGAVPPLPRCKASSPILAAALMASSTSPCSSNWRALLAW